MKLGILTQPLHTNYGGLLQNYALQQILIRAGHDVETIDWKYKDGLYAILYIAKAYVFSLLFPQRYKAPNYMPTAKEKSIIQKNTNHFIDTYLKRTTPVSSLNGFQERGDKGCYDGFVVGSDQCWRPIYNPFLPAMFLCFAKDKKIKRVAYAASFGTDQWEFKPSTTKLCADLIQKFDLVTAREDSGVKLCKDFLGVEASDVLDPTLLLTKEDYIKLIEAENEPQSAGTLFNYILDPDSKKTDFINRVSDELGLKPFQVLPKCQAETRTKDDVKNRIEDCVFPGVTTWLRAFMDAEMTIVDSFHGMVFSLIFNKPFWVIGNVERGMSRFTSLLKLFHLEDRLLDVSELDKVDFKRPIAWNIVNDMLDKKRIESKKLLLDALK